MIEFYTPEGCSIREISNDSGDEEVSVALARVKPGVATELHKLKDVSERYLILEGKGIIDVQGLEQARVCPGDLVRIPPDTAQRITNDGEDDLLFYCICSPPFRVECYISL